jgi:hypothetical protein
MGSDPAQDKLAHDDEQPQHLGLSVVPNLGYVTGGAD